MKKLLESNLERKEGEVLFLCIKLRDLMFHVKPNRIHEVRSALKNILSFCHIVEDDCEKPSEPILSSTSPLMAWLFLIHLMRSSFMAKERGICR